MSPSPSGRISPASTQPAPHPAQASSGCLFLFAAPFIVFGLVMLATAYAAFDTGAVGRSLRYGLGAVAGLGLGIAIIRGRRLTADEGVSAHAPFAYYYAVGGVLILLGIFALRAALGYQQTGEPDGAVAFGIIAAFLLLLGAWFVVGGRIETNRDAPLVAALRRMDPEPWRYVSRWADGQARESGRDVRRQIFVAVVWNVVAWPIAVVTLLSSERPGTLLGISAWVPVVIALAMAIRAARAVRHRRRHGETVFTMDTFPGVVGGSLEGTVWTQMDLAESTDTTFTATLISLRRRERLASSKPRREHTRELSRQQQTVPVAVRRQEADQRIGMRIAFTIPMSAAPTTLHDDSDRVLWRLVVTSDSSSRPFRAEMEVPVFDLRDPAERSLEVPELPAPEAEPEKPVAGLGPDWEREPAPAAARTYRPESLLDRVFPSTDARIAIDEEPGGGVTVQSESGDPTRSGAGMALAIVCLLAFFQIMSSPELQSIDGIGLLPIVGFVAGVWMWLLYRHRTAKVTLSAFDVTLRGGSVKEGEVMLAYDEIGAVSVETGVERGQPQRSGTVNWAIPGFDIMVTTRDGRTYLAGLRAPDRRRAQWLAGTLNRRIAAAARQRDR